MAQYPLANFSKRVMLGIHSYKFLTDYFIELFCLRRKAGKAIMDRHNVLYPRISAGVDGSQQMRCIQTMNDIWHNGIGRIALDQFFFVAVSDPSLEASPAEHQLNLLRLALVISITPWKTGG